MTTNDDMRDAKTAAIEAVKDRTERLDQVQIVANAAIAALSRERAEAVRKALEAGVGVTELARELGVSRGRVYQLRDGV
ncbi:helix-turn-helix domain-containing protein [Corynebacterium hansenii]|uniref:Helix-turn-helix domain-containing protein n=1 Tax=Corynebacterium hansenii TaxID=394964 RepID=A0ABV7ZL76_9CORY|nr:helix-turn-helix domain-containing protein [Corynebacterium hansenii]